MKVFLLRVGVFAFLATGLFYGEASAESGKVYHNSLSEEKQYVNRSFSSNKPIVDGGSPRS